MCFPGAGIGDVSDRLEACMAGEGTKPIACLSVGGKDVGHVGSKEFFRRFREALGKVRDMGGIPLVCGVLPKRAVGGMWQSKAIALNCRLAEHFEDNGGAFADSCKPTLPITDSAHD